MKNSHKILTNSGTVIADVSYSPTVRVGGSRRVLITLILDKSPVLNCTYNTSTWQGEYVEISRLITLSELN